MPRTEAERSRRREQKRRARERKRTAAASLESRPDDVGAIVPAPRRERPKLRTVPAPTYLSPALPPDRLAQLLEARARRLEREGN